MTRTEAEALLNCKLIIIDEASESLPEEANAQAEVKLFTALNNYSGKIIYCVVGEFDTAGYTLPSDNLVDSVQAQVDAHLKASGFGDMRDLTVETYRYNEDLGREIPSITYWRDTAIVTEDLINGN